ncbi:MAG: hypothetical protein E7441_02830 [Ruminococcaceae bacterium]|nr:hypothetical protein [Oscillospiraceae bacterium]
MTDLKNDIGKIDRNLEVKKNIDVSDCVFYDVKNPSFRIYGLCDLNNGFRRLPQEIAKAGGEKIERLSAQTAGGRVRFSTDSEYIAIRCVMPYITRFSHMQLMGTSGFDMYIFENGKSRHINSFMPSSGIEDGYSSVYHFGGRKKREIIINFPPYNPVQELCIGVEENAEISAGSEYTYKLPVVYYGSSITQGACASRPGNTYTALISHEYDCDYINLGFSGAPMGNEPIVDYISELDMSAFVYDFDYNAPSMDYLQETHAQIFNKIREKQPELPIIIMSAADAPVLKNIEKKRDIAFKTYSDARSGGDENVYFIDGKKLYEGPFSESCRVDGVHPTDAGFFRMADIVGKQIISILMRG